MRARAHASPLAHFAELFPLTLVAVAVTVAVAMAVIMDIVFVDKVWRILPQRKGVFELVPLFLALATFAI